MAIKRGRINFDGQKASLVQTVVANNPNKNSIQNLEFVSLFIFFNILFTNEFNIFFYKEFLILICIKIEMEEEVN